MPPVTVRVTGIRNGAFFSVGPETMTLPLKVPAVVSFVVSSVTAMVSLASVQANGVCATSQGWSLEMVTGSQLAESSQMAMLCDAGAEPPICQAMERELGRALSV
jgi:hypothetical protein